MKRILSLILAVVVLTLSSCEGVYTPPVTPEAESCPPHRDLDKSGICDKCGAVVELPGGSDEGGSDEPFTVKLTLDGEDFIPDDDETIFVQWTDGFNYHSAELVDGVASVVGLDGDYRVTLSSVPSGYAYNPNIYIATSESRDIAIELREISKIRGVTSSTGSGLYNCFKISGTGIYTVEINRASQVAYFEFSPTREGTYTIESWVDVTENRVNPIMDLYNGTFAAKYFDSTIDGGAASSTYTKNFQHKINTGEAFIGNTYTFGVRVSEIGGKYPQKIVFAVTRNGTFDPPTTEYEMVIPTERFERTPEYDSSLYTYTEAYTTVGGVKLYDSTRFGYNEERGCYCLYNEQTGKFDGPILYAKINLPTLYLDRSLAGIELDNNSLRISATEDYSLFVKGWSAIVAEWDVWLDSLSEEEFDYYADSIEAQGYATYCNSDGVYKVTEELKDFLQKFSISQLYFRDGDGWVEWYDVYADEDSQWLFACGYYVEN